MSHTPTPWEFTGVMLEADGQGIAYPIGNDREEDMRLIVKAVNVFAPLVEALREVEWSDDNSCPQCARNYRKGHQENRILGNALKLAEG